MAGVSSQLYSHCLTEHSVDPVGKHQPGANPEWSLTATLALKAEVDLIPWKVSEAIALVGFREARTRGGFQPARPSLVDQSS